MKMILMLEGVRREDDVVTVITLIGIIEITLGIDGITDVGKSMEVVTIRQMTMEITNRVHVDKEKVTAMMCILVTIRAQKSKWNALLMGRGRDFTNHREAHDVNPFSLTYIHNDDKDRARTNFGDEIFGRDMEVSRISFII